MIPDDRASTLLSCGRNVPIPPNCADSELKFLYLNKRSRWAFWLKAEQNANGILFVFASCAVANFIRG